MLRRYLIEPYRLNDGLTGEVHKGLRLHEHDALAAYIDRCCERLEARAVDADVLFSGHGVRRHEARVVAGALVFKPGVAEKHDEPAYPAGLFEKHLFSPQCWRTLLNMIITIRVIGLHTQCTDTPCPVRAGQTDAAGTVAIYGFPLRGRLLPQSNRLEMETSS